MPTGDRMTVKFSFLVNYYRLEQKGHQSKASLQHECGIPDGPDVCAEWNPEKISTTPEGDCRAKPTHSKTCNCMVLCTDDNALTQGKLCFAQMD